MCNTNQPVTWLGSTKCDLCEEDIPKVVGALLYDGRIKSRTCWAVMCEICFNIYGAGVGLGVGQEYRYNEDEKFAKVN